MPNGQDRSEGPGSTTRPERSEGASEPRPRPTAAAAGGAVAPAASTEGQSQPADDMEQLDATARLAAKLPQINTTPGLPQKAAPSAECGRASDSLDGDSVSAYALTAICLL